MQLCCRGTKNGQPCQRVMGHADVDLSGYRLEHPEPGMVNGLVTVAGLSRTPVTRWYSYRGGRYEAYPCLPAGYVCEECGHAEGTPDGSSLPTSAYRVGNGEPKAWPVDAPSLAPTDFRIADGAVVLGEAA